MENICCNPPPFPSPTFTHEFFSPGGGSRTFSVSWKKNPPICFHLSCYLNLNYFESQGGQLCQIAWYCLSFTIESFRYQDTPVPGKLGQLVTHFKLVPSEGRYCAKWWGYDDKKDGHGNMQGPCPSRASGDLQAVAVVSEEGGREWSWALWKRGSRTKQAFAEI